MSVFEMINQAVLDAAAQSQSAAGAAAQSGGAGAALGGVDVEAALTAREQAKGGQGLNWKSSIVDLMKLLDLDSSLDNRKALATELGYTGALDGSAEMNIWLHRKVMEQLAANGATVPASLAD
ncbi:MAG TPA: DUF3597 domain-containing protein [Allosphingosinicella sp.]|nr:DUF3597 domain-containing protein [Allosphingosinicella sp.]